MRIAVDARPVYQEPTLRGVGKTLVGLYRAMAADRPGWRFDLYHQTRNDSPDPFADLPNVGPRQTDGPGDRFGAWQHVWLPAAARNADVLHAHGAIAPRFPLGPLVTTIHDLTPLEFRATEPGVREWARNVGRAARKSRRIVACSEHTRADVVKTFGIPSDKITVVRWGPNEAMRKVTDAASVRAVVEKYGIAPGRRYLLHFGMALARKNTRRVFDAWAALSPADRGDAVLLVVGLEGRSHEEFAAVVRERSIEESCRLHGYVPEDDVPALLTGSTGVVYVPLSEGFGLPLLDAFACDVPVLASAVTSIPEVAGDACLLVDPTSTNAIRDGMARLLNDAATADELVGRGRARLGQFCWKACANEVADVLEAAAG